MNARVQEPIPDEILSCFGSDINPLSPSTTKIEILI